MNTSIAIGLSGAFAFALPSSSVGQEAMAEMLRGNTALTFIGLDFSKASFLTRSDFPGLNAQGPSYFNRWNELLSSEQEKFDLGGPMRLEAVPTSTEFVQEVNAAVQLEDAWATTTPVFLKEDIPEMVKKYRTDNAVGVGCVFIVGNFNTALLRGDLYVTFFNMKTREVLHSEWIVGRPAGLGERNFWAGAIKDVLEQISGTYRKSWEQKYLKGK